MHTIGAKQLIRSAPDGHENEILIDFSDLKLLVANAIAVNCLLKFHIFALNEE